jgi:enoyl-CoA hydratase/carnithine racemase
MSDEVLLRSDDAGITTLTLNRPEKRNALSAALLTALQSELDSVGPDRSVRVVVIAANGPIFSSGHDLKEIRALGDAEKIEELFLACSRVMTTIAELPKPVIAKVHGMATAAGCQLVAACDLAIASSKATFATPGVNTGSFCATPGVALSRTVSRKHALEMLLTGEPITAARAAEIGLVNRVVAPERLDEEVASLARLIATKSPGALASGKRLFARQLEMPLRDAYSLASGVISRDFVSDEAVEGVSAFFEKRAPRWS